MQSYTRTHMYVSKGKKTAYLSLDCINGIVIQWSNKTSDKG